jgi:cell division protein FtsI/penicillin-binding protein 2
LGPLLPSSNGIPPHFERTLNGKYIEDRESYRFVYTVDPALQTSVNEILRSRRPLLGTFVAIEPKTGKILALIDYARGNPEYTGIWQRATYPAASIFKLITAAGALEKGLLSYDSPVFFGGNLYRLAPQKINKTSKWERQTNFDEALGKSNNVVFGRVASKLMGPQTLREYSEAFGFNHPIQFDFPLDMSRASIPEGPYELARCGAGFGEVTLNPLHAAMIVAAIANSGVMMRPYLIKEIIDQDGEKVYQAKAEVLAQPIRSKTAQDLSRMMLRTVEDGTASKIFHRYGKNLLKKMSICGKTGSRSGDTPPGLYDWFVGFAPGDTPQIAFAAMVVNQNRSKVKGAFVAQEALKTFFREQIN